MREASNGSREQEEQSDQFLSVRIMPARFVLDACREGKKKFNV